MQGILEVSIGILTNFYTYKLIYLENQKEVQGFYTERGRESEREREVKASSSSMDNLRRKRGFRLFHSHR